MSTGTECHGNDQHLSALLEMATESWRFTKVFCRVLTKLDDGEQNRYLSQYRYFAKNLKMVFRAWDINSSIWKDRYLTPGWQRRP